MLLTSAERPEEGHAAVQEPGRHAADLQQGHAPEGGGHLQMRRHQRNGAQPHGSEQGAVQL
jgi:hypothetical protein